MKFVVLRDLSSPQFGSPFGALVRGARPIDVAWANTVAPPTPSIEVVDTDQRGHNDLARQPDVVDIAHQMPIRLIQPLANPTPGGGGAVGGGGAWGVDAVGATTSSATGAGVVVAVLDTGLDITHEAFLGVDVVEQDFSGKGTGDRNGHGTHCAATIVGRDVGGTRIGIARGVTKLLTGKVLDDNGAGTSDAAFAGIDWAVQQGAQVISMSLGFDFPGMVTARVNDNWPVDLATSSALEGYRANLRMFDALMQMIRVREAFSPGAVVVAAAGNESRRDVSPNYEIAVSLPAAAEGVLSVGAVGRSADGYHVAPFSNTFPRLCGPGVDITSAKPGGGLASMSGTSMACPHVAGVAALWWEAVRTSGLPPVANTVVARLQATARVDVFAAGTDEGDRGQGLAMAPP